MADRFHVRRALHGLLAGALPVRKSLFEKSRLGVVMSQQLRRSARRVIALPFEGAGDLAMILLPRGLEQGLVRGILDQCVLEDVA